MTLLFTDHDEGDIQYNVEYSDTEMKLLFTADELAIIVNGGSVTSNPLHGNHNTVKSDVV